MTLELGNGQSLEEFKGVMIEWALMPLSWLLIEIWMLKELTGEDLRREVSSMVKKTYITLANA